MTNCTAITSNKISSTRNASGSTNTNQFKSVIDIIMNLDEFA